MAATLQVIMVCYNERQFVDGRMEQLLGQTRPADEIIVVDDGSTDGSLERLQEIAAEHPSVKVYSNGTNRGIIYTSNRAKQLATADYLYFAGVDDITMPTCFEKCMAMLEANPGAPLAYSPAGFLNEATGQTSVDHVGLQWAASPVYFTGAEIAMMAEGHPIGGAPTIYKRAALEEFGFLEELKWHSDGFAATVLALRHGMVFVPEVLIVVRVRDASYSSAGKRDWAQEGPLLDRLLHLLKSEELADVLPLYQQGKMFCCYGPRIVQAVLQNPAHWDLDSFRLIRPMLGAVLQSDEAMQEFLVGGLRNLLEEGKVGAAPPSRLLSPA